jgi:hypothetical protein
MWQVKLSFDHFLSEQVPILNSGLFKRALNKEFIVVFGSEIGLDFTQCPMV